MLPDEWQEVTRRSCRLPFVVPIGNRCAYQLHGALADDTRRAVIRTDSPSWPCRGLNAAPNWELWEGFN